jgi:hypothetical protein
VSQIHARQVKVSRRQVADASKFEDHHYATFYGGEFGNVSSSVLFFDLVQVTLLMSSFRARSFGLAV